jgi:hypothetical protein
MKLSREEESFLRRWMHDEVHYRDDRGPAKALQLRHGVAPADLAAIIAAGIPDSADQESSAADSPSGAPVIWPWTDADFHRRLAEARSIVFDRINEANGAAVTAAEKAPGSDAR